MSTSAVAPRAREEGLLRRESFVELGARERAVALLDPGTSCASCWAHSTVSSSPWLAPQGVVPQYDDGTVVLRGTIDAVPAVVLAVEGAFQGGSTGEVSGAKIAGALELALRDVEVGRAIWPVLVFETGGVRLQEANLGLAAVAEINAAIVALRRHVPVVGVIAGMVGCFGGMSIAAGLCSQLIVTRQARLGLNGPEVIEQECRHRRVGQPRPGADLEHHRRRAARRDGLCRRAGRRRCRADRGRGAGGLRARSAGHAPQRRHRRLAGADRHDRPVTAARRPNSSHPLAGRLRAWTPKNGAEAGSGSSGSSARRRSCRVALARSWPPMPR